MNKMAEIKLIASVRMVSDKMASVLMKLAKPEVVERSVLYLRLSGDQTDPRFMNLSFFSPKIRLHGDATQSYKIEIGDWDIDKNYSIERIKKSLSKVTIPSIKQDILEEDYDIFSKATRRLRSIVLEQGIEYFQLPVEEKKRWKNTIRLDVQRLMDTKVVIEEPEKEPELVVASAEETPTKTSMYKSKFLSRK